MAEFVFASQSSQRSDDPANTSERLVNMYAEPAAQGSKAGLTLRSVLGLESFVQLPALIGRRVIGLDGFFYVVASARLFQVSPAGVVVELAEIADDPETAISSNGSQVTISANGTYYVWTGTDLVQPTGGRIENVGWVDFKDGYTILIDRDSGEFEWTELGDPTTRNALHFADAESQNDKLLRSQVNGKELWLMGERSSEVWQNTGLANENAFRSVAAIDRGVLGRNLATKISEVQVIVGNDGVVYKIVGFRLEPVSTPPVENSISDMTPTNVFSYEDRGRKFAVVRFGDRPAWTYDISTRQWHERASDVYLNAFNIVDTVSFRKSWWGLSEAGALLGFARTNMDVDTVLARVMQSRPVRMLGEWLTVDEVQLFGEVGASNIGRDAQVAMQVSRDGGVTWEPEQWRSLGTLGQRKKRLEWHSQGAGEEMAFRFKVTDPTDVNLYGVGNVVVS